MESILPVLRDDKTDCVTSVIKEWSDFLSGNNPSFAPRVTMHSWNFPAHSPVNRKRWRRRNMWKYKTVQEVSLFEIILKPAPSNSDDLVTLGA